MVYEGSWMLEYIMSKIYAVTMISFIWLHPYLYPASMSDAAQRRDSWRPRLRSSNSGNHCISGIRLTAVDS